MALGGVFDPSNGRLMKAATARRLAGAVRDIKRRLPRKVA
jgi:hypothetical protein